jgi:hypothetical protein
MSGYDSDPFVKLRKKIFGEDKKAVDDSTQESTMKRGGKVEHKHNVEHSKKHAAGFQHEQEKVKAHAAGHKVHHEHVKAMCGGGKTK